MAAIDDLLCDDCDQPPHADNDDHNYYSRAEIRRAHLSDPRDVAAMRRELDALRERAERAEAAVETAWGIIANANGGDWGGNTEWRLAAERWRDEYILANRKATP